MDRCLGQGLPTDWLLMIDFLKVIGNLTLQKLMGDTRNGMATCWKRRVESSEYLNVESWRVCASENYIGQIISFPVSFGGGLQV